MTAAAPVFISVPPTTVEEGGQYRYVLRAVDVPAIGDEGDGGDGGDGGDEGGGGDDRPDDEDEIGDEDGEDDDRGRGRGRGNDDDDDDEDNDDDDDRGGRGRDDDDDGGDKLLAITYQAPLLPAWLSFDGIDTISGSPGAADIGTHPVRVTASNGSATAVQSFQILVAAPNSAPPPRGPASADLAAAIAVAPNPVGIGVSAVWTFSVENRSEVDVANVALRAELAAEVPLVFDVPSDARCALLAGNPTVIDCHLGPLSRRASETIHLGASGSAAGDVRGTVTASISDAAPIDDNPDNNVARATLAISERIGGGPVQLLSVSGARASVAGDLDGDGMVDLAVAGGASVVVFKGTADSVNPNKRIVATRPVSLGRSPGANAIAAADLDGDGDLDLVTANGPGASDTVLLSSGATAFTASALEGSAESSRAVVTGDLDGDTLPDLVFVKAQASTVYTNDGAGGFLLATSISSHDARSAVIADLFGDALPELVFATADGDAPIYRRGAQGFELVTTIATGPTTAVAAADFDGDADLDLVFGRDRSATSASTPVYRNDWSTTSAFVLSAELEAADTVAVLPADFDTDGDIDIVTITAAGGHQLHLNDGASGATFTAHSERFVLGGATSGTLGKISIDHRDDVIVTGSGRVGIFFNDGTGNFGAGDTVPPTLTLQGPPTVEFTVGLAYQELGAVAVDAIDGDLTSKIVVTNPVDPAVVGTYTVVYNVADSSGNEATPAIRSVHVRTQSGEGGGGGGAIGFELLLLGLLALFKLPRRVVMTSQML